MLSSEKIDIILTNSVTDVGLSFSQSSSKSPAPAFREITNEEFAVEKKKTSTKR